MSLQLLKSDIESKHFRRIYYICGDEPYLKHYYYNELKKALFSGETDHPDCVIKNASELELSEFIDAVSSYPIFAERKAVILKDLSLSGEIAEWLLKHIKEIEENNVIIIYQISESADSRLSIFKLFKKAVSDYGLWVDIGPLDQQTLFKWVCQQFRKHGKTIDPQTVSYFISSTSTDMYSLSNEIMKLSFYCNVNITVEDIDKITSKTIDAKTYELTNAVFDKNPEKVFSVLKTLSDMRTNEIMIMASIYSSVTTLYKTKLLFESGLSPSEIELELGQKGFVVNKNLAKLKTISFDTLEKIIDICTETDIISKTTSVDYTELLSELIMSIIELI